MVKIAVLLVIAFVCSTSCLPLENSVLQNDVPALAPKAATKEPHEPAQAHKLWRRFINPFFSGGLPDTDDIVKMRTKRSYDECEKLQLCKLHARSRQSFFAAYELYFVNKENARLWDHRARSAAECEERFGDCYEK